MDTELGLQTAQPPRKAAAVHAGAVTIAFNSTTCVIKWADGSRTVCAGGTRARAIKMN